MSNQAHDDEMGSSNDSLLDRESEHFFAAGDALDATPERMDDGLVDDAAPARVSRLLAPDVVARRLRFRRVVEIVVGAFTIVALAGLGKSAMAHSPETPIAYVAPAWTARIEPRFDVPAPAINPPKKDDNGATAANAGDLGATKKDVAPIDALAIAHVETQLTPSDPANPADPTTTAPKNDTGSANTIAAHTAPKARRRAAPKDDDFSSALDIDMSSLDVHIE